MSNTIVGSCHCGNLAYELRTEVAPAEIRARACDCRFCRIHAAQNWSDPHGSATILVANEQSLSRYRFALRTADFLVCRNCGAYLGAVLTEAGQCWSTINLRLSKLVVDASAASYGHERTADRIERRKRVWTPTTLRVGASETRADHSVE